jgi:hypothetical protein
MGTLWLFLSLLFGWILGLVGPFITEKILNKSKRESVQKIIVNELKDVKKRLSGLPIKIKSSYGELDNAIFSWTREQTNGFLDYTFGDSENRAATMDTDLNNQGFVEEVISSWNISSRRDNPSFRFQKMEMSITDSNASNFGILDNAFLVSLLEIQFQIRVFNNEVEAVSEYLKMTFDSNVSGDNHAIIQREIKRKNNLLSEKAIHIVSIINTVIPIKK